MSIRPPKQSGHYEDRAVNCQESLEQTLLDILNEAQEAGWSQGETMDAIEALIIAFRQAHDHHRDPDYGAEVSAV